jgi:hypothetical protein
MLISLKVYLRLKNTVVVEMIVNKYSTSDCKYRVFYDRQSSCQVMTKEEFNQLLATKFLDSPPMQLGCAGLSRAGDGDVINVAAYVLGSKTRQVVCPSTGKRSIITVYKFVDAVDGKLEADFSSIDLIIPGNDESFSPADGDFVFVEHVRVIATYVLGGSSGLLSHTTKPGFEHTLQFTGKSIMWVGPIAKTLAGVTLAPLQNEANRERCTVRDLCADLNNVLCKHTWEVQCHAQNKRYVP